MKAKTVLVALLSITWTFWLAGATVAAVWSSVADAPWEKIATREAAGTIDKPVVNPERTPVFTSTPSPVATPTPALEVMRTPNPLPTPYQRRITGAEAANIVRREMNRRSNESFFEPVKDAQGQVVEWRVRASVLEQPLPIFREYTECKAVDFNDYLRAWIVSCTGNIVAVKTGNKLPFRESELFRLSDLTQTLVEGP